MTELSTIEKLLSYVPDEFKLNAIGYLTGVNLDEAWMVFFTSKYPAEIKAFLKELRKEPLLVMPAPARGTGLPL